jgi:DNA end-binding protein Ku
MAEDLIAGMSIDWSPSDYRETYYDDLQRLIKGRIHRGQTQAIDEAESPAIASNVFDLLPLLKQSLQTAQRARRAPRPKAAPASRRRKS